MLDFVATIAVTITMVVAVNAFITTVSPDRVRRLSLAALAGAWIGLAVALGSIGEFADAGRRVPPLVGVMFATPLLATAAVALIFPAVRTALLAVPTPLLIGLNALRVFGAFFLLLAAAGRLGGPFPYSAGWGDVITGVLALPVAFLVARGGGIQAAQWWNAFGALDLVVAVFLGVTSAPGSPLQLFHSGEGSNAVQYLPYVLIPTVLVPFFLITHAIIFAQLRSGVLRHARELSASQ